MYNGMTFKANHTLFEVNGLENDRFNEIFRSILKKKMDKRRDFMGDF